MMGGKKILLAALLLVLVGALYFVFSGKEETKNVVEADMVHGESTGVYLTGLTDLEGNAAVMNDEKVVFLNVWATWCGPCNIEMPGIQTLYNKYKDNPKVSFYIVSDEDAGTVTPFIAKKGYELPFFQYRGNYPAMLDGNAIPRTYIIHKGKILVSEIGASQWDRPDIHALIDASIAEI